MRDHVGTRVSALTRWVLTATLLLVALPAQGSGIYTPETGIVAMGRAGNFVALCNDYMAAYYNPAGLYQLDGVQFGGGLLLLDQQTSFIRAGGDGRFQLDDNGDYIVDSNGDPVLDGSYREVNNLFRMRPIPEVAFSVGFKKPDLTIALGLYAPLAPNMDYDPYGPQRYRSYYTRMIQGNLFLAAGWRPIPQFAVGAGFQLIMIQLEHSFVATGDLETGADDPNPEHPQWDIDTEMKASQFMPFFNVGVLIMPVEQLRFGISFQPPYSMDGEGEVSLSGELAGEYMESFGGLVNDNSPLYLQGVDEDMMLSTDMPAILRWGVLVQPNQYFNIGLDAQVEFWQRAKGIDATEVDVPLMACDENGENCQSLLDEVSGRFDSMDVCETGLIDCATLGTYKGPDGDGSFHIAQGFRNSIGIKLGGEVRPIPEHFAIRFGYGFETAAIPDETISVTIFDSTKHTAAVGVSGLWRGFSVHFSYAHIFYHERVISEDVATEVTTGLEGAATNKIDAGTYNASADMLGLSVSFNFTGMHQAAKEKKAARTKAAALTLR
jgi:long-subunit fatty acid transport protein